MKPPWASAARTDYSRLTLSRCATYRTDDGKPHGRIIEVRCPNRIHCLHFLPIVRGQLMPHGAGCVWSGAEFIDDRDQLAGHPVYNSNGITVLLVPGARTRPTGTL
ncbi:MULTISPECIES: hypothetical protein [Nocardia]|uniref:hypothetical protein n=1 Tax=Nocardia TaxID=1817 RepID=UPI001892F823|nr:MULTISPECIES: hypothetical protein [Nocardia]MBF6288487.1 hypothetical protein [Nocardia cyriacigeorgica]